MTKKEQRILINLKNKEKKKLKRTVRIGLDCAPLFTKIKPNITDSEIKKYQWPNSRGNYEKIF